jgi:hypothetical protein
MIVEEGVYTQTVNSQEWAAQSRVAQMMVPSLGTKDSGEMAQKCFVKGLIAISIAATSNSLPASLGFHQEGCTGRTSLP